MMIYPCHLLLYRPPLPSLSAGDDVVYEQSLSYYQLKQSTLGKGAGEVPPQSYISRNQLRWWKKSHEYQ